MAIDQLTARTRRRLRPRHRSHPAAERAHAGAAAAAAVREHARACPARRSASYDDAGPAWAWKTLTVGEHVGTHFDAPIHWITGRDGEDVASVAAGEAGRSRWR